MRTIQANRDKEADLTRRLAAVEALEAQYGDDKVVAPPLGNLPAGDPASPDGTEIGADELGPLLQRSVVLAPAYAPLSAGFDGDPVQVGTSFGIVHESGAPSGGFDQVILRVSNSGAVNRNLTVRFGDDIASNELVAQVSPESGEQLVVFEWLLGPGSVMKAQAPAINELRVTGNVRRLSNGDLVDPGVTIHALSEGGDGHPILVDAYPTPTKIHEVPSDQIDELWLWAFSVGVAPGVLTLRWGANTSANGIPRYVNAGYGAELIMAGGLLTAGKVVYAVTDGARADYRIAGFVRRRSV